MERNDWTPAVLITATVCLVTAGLVWLANPWDGTGLDAPGRTRARHRLPAEVIVWVGQFKPDVKAVLGPIWGDTKPDRDHDLLLNQDLGLTGERALSYYRLLLFNTSSDAQTVDLEDGRIVMEGEDGARAVLRNLAEMVERGELALKPAQEISLRALGALSKRVEIPPGSAANLLVPFEGSVRIESVRVVGIANESEFRRRQMARATFRKLREDPDEARVKDL